MDHDGSVGWHSLGQDLHLSILSVLKHQEDKGSLQAVLQTSRDLRLLASSLISSIEIRDASALSNYPRHAAAIVSMRLRMRPSPGVAHMEPPFMVTWLSQITMAACNRFAAVTIVHVELPGVLLTVDPATMDSLLASIGRACPNLRSLRMDGIHRAQEDLIQAMFAAIGQHLPGIIELQLELDLDVYCDDFDFAINGIDWAACLPRGLQKFRSEVGLHHELLQQLVLMPSLTEVTVWCLSVDLEVLFDVQSESCAWRTLSLIGVSRFPFYWELARFTAAMPLLHLNCDEPFEWYVGHGEEEHAMVAEAAAWLSQIRNCPTELTLELSRAVAATSTAGIFSSLAPLTSLVTLQLDKWPVSEETLEELALGGAPQRGRAHLMVLLRHQGCLGPPVVADVGEGPQDL